MEKPPEGNRSPLEAPFETLPAAWFHTLVQKVGVMLKVDRKTEMSRIGPTVDFFRADVQNFHYDDLRSD
jgi:hypothetical protein